MKNIKHTLKGTSITTEKNLKQLGATLTDTHKGTIKVYEYLTHQYIVNKGKVVSVFEPYKQYSHNPLKKVSRWDALQQDEERRLNHLGREDLI